MDVNLPRPGFRVFRSSINSTGIVGQLIADVRTPSANCGQQFKPTFIVDRDTGEIPGTRVKYLVATVSQNDDGKAEVDVPKKITYTSPWVGILTVSVVSPSNDPVEGVDILVQHLSPTVNVVNSNFRLNLVTTDVGSVLHEIYVTDPAKWGAVEQRFRVTPSKCEGVRIPDGTCCTVDGVGSDGISCDEFGIEHQFDAQEGQSGQIVMRHEFEGSVEFIDTTVRSVVVFVIFGEAESSSSFSALYGDWLDPDACTEFYDQLDGRCYCAIPEVDVDFEDSPGDCGDGVPDGFESSGCDRQTTDVRGYATQSVDFGKDKTVKFQGYKDHLFEIWDITEGTSAYTRVATASQTPEVSFTNIREQKRLAIVDVTISRLSATVLGGHRNVPFVTGQALLVTARTNECGFNKQMVTYRGTADEEVMPALDVAVELTPAGPDCGTSGLERPDSSADVRPCRVPAPLATHDNPRYSCADPDRLGFSWVDEYFADKEDERIQTADLGVLRDATVSYVYVAPLCLRQVQAGPTNPTGKPLLDIVSRTTDRTDWTDDEPEDLLLMEPEALDIEDSNFGATVVPNDRSVFVEEDEISFKFELVEVYPGAGTCEWPWDYISNPEGCSLRIGDTTTTGSFLSDVSPDHEVLITYLDGITGGDVMVDAATYVSNLTEDYNFRYDEFRPGYILNAVAGEPTPFAPFTVDVTVIFNRKDDGSYVVFDRSAILLGVISEAVPQTITMTTAPTLIFSIIRDPPGGTSRTVMAQGAEISTTLSIDQCRKKKSRIRDDIIFHFLTWSVSGVLNVVMILVKTIFYFFNNIFFF